MSDPLVLITNDLEGGNPNGRSLLASVVADNGRGRLIVESSTKIDLQDMIRTADNRGHTPGLAAHPPSVHYISGQPFDIQGECLTVTFINSAGDAILYALSNLKIARERVFPSHASADGQIDIMTSPDVPVITFRGSKTPDPAESRAQPPYCGYMFQAWGSPNPRESDLNDWLRTTIRTNSPNDQGEVPGFETIAGGAEGLGNFAAYKDEEGHLYIRTLGRVALGTGRVDDQTIWSQHLVSKTIRSRSIPALAIARPNQSMLHVFYVDWEYHLRHFSVPVDNDGAVIGVQDSGEIAAANDKIITPMQDLNWKDMRPRALFYGNDLYCFFGMSGANKGHGMSSPERKVAYVKSTDLGESWSQSVVLDVRMPDDENLAGFGIAEAPRSAVVA